jgi:SM-20-related protein
MPIVDDILLTDELLKPCADWLDNANWRYGWKSNVNIEYGHWNVDITKKGRKSEEDVTHTLPPEFAAVWQVLNYRFFDSEGYVVRCYSNRHTFGTEGFVHRDSERTDDYSCVIYMNEKWEAKWGGDTAFYNSDLTEIVQSVMPRHRRVVMFPGAGYHCARAVSRICPEARTTLMFKLIVPSTEERLKRFLAKTAAFDMPHKNGSLGAHLMRVFQILKSVGADDMLALIGGLHSVYSTNVYKRICLPWENTDVARVFGPHVDRLVRMFCSINRPRVLENPDGTMDMMDLFYLRCVECANLLDQNALSAQKFPNLHLFEAQLRAS